MKTMSISAGTSDLSEVPERYSRAANTPFSRTALSKMRFVVVGAGALGNELVKNLGLLGAGSVLVIDPDTIELSNLSRSIFFRVSDCGQHKAEALCASLTCVFPHTEWEFRNREIADIGFSELRGADLILTCVDTDLARMETAWAALRLDIPMMDGGLGGADYWRGRVSFFAGRSSACFCCKLPPRRRRELLALTLANGHSCWQAETTVQPSTPTMAAIIGALQLDFGLRCLNELQTGEVRHSKSPSIEISLDSNAKLSRFVTNVSESCPFHAVSAQPRVAPPDARATARELLDHYRADVIDLDWPICVTARCLDCSSEWKPRKRVGWLRRHERCHSCGGRRILEQENISLLDRKSAWADTPLPDLGLPEHHLYAVRPATDGESG